MEQDVLRKLNWIFVPSFWQDNIRDSIFASLYRPQCDQIGRFLKDIGDKISNKSSPNDWKLFGQLKKPHLNVKTTVATFWATFGNIWATFTPNSGHTDRPSSHQQASDPSKRKFHRDKN